MPIFTSVSADRAQCFNLRHQEFYHHDLSAPSIRRMRIGPTSLTMEWAGYLPTTLEYLDWDMGDERAVDECVLMVLLSRPSLKRLSLRFRDPNIVPVLSNCLEKSKHLEHLDLRNNLIGDKGALYLVRALFHSSITAVNLGFNLIGDHGARALARLLAHPNCKLMHLDLNCNLIGNYGAIELAEALSWNRTLKSLVLYGNSRLSCGDSFVNCLHANNTLESCDLQRTEVDQVDVIEYFLTLNKCGRRILKLSDDDVPSGIWPIFLDRVSQKSGDAMYYFCSQKPELFHQ